MRRRAPAPPPQRRQNNWGSSDRPGRTAGRSPRDRREAPRGERTSPHEALASTTREHREAHRSVPTRSRHASRSRHRRWWSAPAAAGNARTTTSPGSSRGSRSRHACRNRRVTRLRTTAPPTLRPTTKPMRGDAPDRLPTCTISVREPARTPCRVAATKSRRERRRAEDGSTRNLRRGSGSSRESLSALATTVGDDRTAGSGPHTQAETVGLVPPTVVRLERALAHEMLHEEEMRRDLDHRVPTAHPLRGDERWKDRLGEASVPAPTRI